MSLILRCQRGFTTVTLMGVLSVGMLLVAGGFSAVGPDISLSRDDQDYKQAYGAAEAGLQWYLSNLAKDNDYYLGCTSVPDPATGVDAPVNQLWNGSGSDPRVWRALTGEDSGYTVELVPATGYSTCSAGDQYSMVDPNGNMRLRVTGRSRDQTRTLLVSLRRRNFLDFIYFTHFETLSPLTYSSSNKRNWAAAHCNQFRTERELENYSGDSVDCSTIQFAHEDDVLGPLHTNDSILACGSPTFGRPDRPDRDAIELNEQDPGWVDDDCGDDPGDPDFQGAVTYPSGQLGVPTSNSELKDLALTGYKFSGKTQIVLKGDTMDVKVKTGSWQTNKPLPANGVIYVETSGSCTTSFAYNQTYPTENNCGNAWVKGEYSEDLTIAAQNDVVINGDLERDEDNDGLLLGLIGNNFVRIEHTIDLDDNDCDDTSTGSHDDIAIHAAILALNHSFIVDNWHCGNGLGTLNVDGAIAQLYRGPVGQADGSGYIKNYTYNDRLRYREPPFFLDPIQSAWRVARQTEQVPAAK